MEYTIKIQSNELIGRYIRCKSDGRIMRGFIQAIILANTQPTKEQMTRLYGIGWINKECKGAFCPIKYDRIMFKNDYDGHHIVLPLDPEMKYIRWEIS